MRDSVLLGLFADLMSALERIEEDMATNEGERALQSAIGRVGAQVGEAVAEIKKLADKLEAHQDVDLTQEVAELNALADRLDAAVPDVTGGDPVPPAPGA